MELKSHIALADKSFSESKANKCRLYLQVSHYDVKLLVFDTTSTTFTALKVYLLPDVYTDHALSEKLKKLMETDAWFQLSFLSVNIAMVNNRATIIPAALLSKEDMAAIHQFNFTPNDTDLYFTDKFLSLSAVNVYSVPEIVANCFDAIKNKQFYHFSTSLISASLLHAKNSGVMAGIDVHVLPGSFQIIITKAQKLVLYNSFTYQTSEDFIYYLLFVLDQQNIDHQKVNIRLLGEVEKNSAIFTLVNTYIHQVTFVEKENLTTNPSLQLSYVFDEIAPAYYYSIFQQYLCE